ncbi:MAG: biopolymer transporter Tol, partial [Ignavibacteria bacterium]|nr:biopolymer transporter Tol [Ignavibacteria bacterium]
NEFQQTNVIGSYLPEGVGGVTELYKNRVVLPFMGNISQFRHVIHHELVHAVMNDMFYGGTFQTAISTGNTMDIPIWMSEGFAEFSSLGGLNTQTDMFMRDVSLSENLTDLKSLSNYYAYRGGQAFYWYVADKYGEQKVGDLLNRLRVTGTAEKAFKSSFNLSMDDFSEQWKKDMKKYYWPDIEKFKDPEDYATRITNHKNDNGFYNSSPSISPNGDKMAFISDRDGTFGIFTVDLNKKDEPERLVNSFRQRDFEQLNILTPGISWDPTGKKLAFIGSSIGQSDVFMYNMKSKKLTNLTNDVFSDFFPVWSKDSKKLYFISDRGGNIDDSKLSPDFRIWNYHYESTDIYSMNVESKIITRIT